MRHRTYLDNNNNNNDDIIISKYSKVDAGQAAWIAAYRRDLRRRCDVSLPTPDCPIVLEITAILFAT